MSYQIKAKREKRAELAKRANEILNKADTEKRALMGTEQAQFDRIHAEIDTLKSEIDRAERQLHLDTELAAVSATPGGLRQLETAEKSSRGAQDAVRSWLLSAVPGAEVTDAQRAHAAQYGVNTNSRHLSFKLGADVPRNMAEARALSVGTTTAGGDTVAQGFRPILEEALLQHSDMRNFCTIMRTETGAKLPMPTVNDTSNKGEIIGENAEVDNQDIVFGVVNLGSFKYSSKMVPVSVELIQDNGVALIPYIGKALSTRIARKYNTDTTVGAGTTEPYGAVTQATSGAVGATGQTTTVKYNDLINLKHSVDPAYRKSPGFAFMFADSTLKALKLLADGQGRPLWAPGIAVGVPDTIDGTPYIINQDMPAMAANAKSVLCGDFSKYFIREVLDVTLLRLDELLANYHQVAFLAFSRMDANLLDAGTHPIKYYANSAT